MCGIAGFAGRGSLEDLRRMGSRLAHRGPDAEGHWCDAARGVFLAHRRLSVLDHEGGAQPMALAAPDGERVITFNGEIYNHAELRRELESGGARFRSDHSDTEVLLHAYRAWGPAMTDRLDGMWAFVIYDPARAKLFGSRDRFGEKPLYYALGDGLFAFASELEALREHPGARGELSPEAIAKYFAYGYFPSPWTPFRRTHKLSPGHSLELDLRTLSLRVTQYWDYVPEPWPWPSGGAARERELNRWSELLLEKLDASVRERLAADVPVGLFLSGGIDSSAVAAAAVRAAEPSRVKTFSIGFRDPSYDESVYAAQVAGYLRTGHSAQTLDEVCLRSVAGETVGSLDEPLGDSSILPTFLLSRFARGSVTVALSGDGGDELFAGYDPFRAVAPGRLYRRWVPAPVRGGLRALARILPVTAANMSWGFRVRRALEGFRYPEKMWLPAWMGPVQVEELAELIPSRSFSPEETYSEAIAAWERYPELGPVDKLGYVFATVYFPDDILEKVDRASMRHSLEVRAPFLDRDVVEVARRIPWQAKLRRGQTKFILRRAIRSRIPGGILDRPKKGFGAPVAGWFRDGALAAAPELPECPWMNPAFAEARLLRHRARGGDERLFLWADWVFRNWLAARRGV
jgi:asparagine synthase (glutamine-hydrolysing)